MADRYHVGREFRLKILALLLDNAWVGRFGSDIIFPEYFDQDDEEAVARAIIDYRDRYGRAPSDPVDIVTMLGGEHEEFVYDVYELAGDADTVMPADVAIEFAREQAVKIAILDGVDDVRGGRLSKIIPRLEDALRIGEDLIMPGIDVVRDSDKWLFDYWIDKVPTGWIHINRVLEGGLGKGEMGVVLGPTNVGKSMTLIDIGYSAASIIGRTNVVHFTHEMSKEQVAKRYAARMLFRFPRPDEDLEKYDKELQDTARRMMPGKVRVIGGASHMNVRDIDTHLARLLSEGFEFGLVIDDSPDLLGPPGKYNERRHEHFATYTYLRELAGKYEVPVWCSSQSNRGSYNKEIVDLNDVAEDIGKVQVSDVVVALCQTKEEYDMEQCRLFLAKVRDGQKHVMVQAKYYGSSQAIVSTGYVKKKGKENGS